MKKQLSHARVYTRYTVAVYSLNGGENNIDFSIEIPNNGDIEISAFGENVDWDAMIGPHGDPEDIADKTFKQYKLIRDNI